MLLIPTRLSVRVRATTAKKIFAYIHYRVIRFSSIAQRWFTVIGDVDDTMVTQFLFSFL